MRWSLFLLDGSPGQRWISRRTQDMHWISRIRVPAEEERDRMKRPVGARGSVLPTVAIGVYP